MRTETVHEEPSQGVPGLQETLRTDERVPLGEKDENFPSQTSDPTSDAAPAEHSPTELEYMNQPEPTTAGREHDINMQRELALSQNIAKACRFIRDMPMTDSADDFAVARDELVQEIAKASEMAKHTMNFTDVICGYTSAGNVSRTSDGCWNM